LRRAPRKQRRGLIEAVHWAFGAGGGAAFGALPRGVRRRPWAGPVYGLMVWLGFELAVAPALGLSQAKRVRLVGNYVRFVADSNGNISRQLTHTTDSGNAQPVFSPDGARVAYINGREATGSGPNGSTISGVANRIWLVATDGSGAAALTPGPLDAYPAWLDAGTILFARSSFLSQTSQVISVTLDGREQAVSPPNQYFVEPRPLPDGRSYGATMESGTDLHLVRISRADRSALTAPGTSDFIIDRLPIPATDGSSFTIAWILGRSIAAPTRPAGDPAFGLLAAGLLVLLLAGAVSLRAARGG